MTTSISNAPAEAPSKSGALQTESRSALAASVKLARTVASRFIFLTICVAIVMTTLAFGTVHYWALAIFEISAAAIVLLWAMDVWRSRVLRFSRNPLQLPLVGLFILGLVQLLPFSGAASADSNSAQLRTISFDPYSTRLALVQIAALAIYFAATLAFTDSPHRLRILVRTIIIFGFVLAIFGLTQSFTSPTKVFWIRELSQSTAFGPFINRHHFAGYMELAMAVPLGLLFSGSIEKEKRPLYAFAIFMMGVALIMTASRGGIISLVAEVGFLVIIAGIKRRKRRHRSEEKERKEGKTARVRSAMVRAGLAFAFVLLIFTGVVMLGGESALTRFLGSVSSSDPTTGRAHFWSVTLDIIRHHPMTGVGLGAYSLVYTSYDTRNGLMRVEQAHNDYLQMLSDAGVVGVILGLFFLVALFRAGFARRETDDKFRRGVATGALAGCFAVLVHSFFDFTLHTTANALLFLIVAALATMNGRIEQHSRGRHRRRSHIKSLESGVVSLESEDSGIKSEVAG
ncbi:MAG: hypothetical protein AUG51_26450 [Acidobacteria bacterium 13_1_20CM_3_53_8]|nr:MAG: hypothetical protein AUG51_26450 [Acidobacteria bacterium 13_1_20CM_3_53_8]